MCVIAFIGTAESMTRDRRPGPLNQAVSELSRRMLTKSTVNRPNHDNDTEEIGTIQC
jgi:hypothetical protein